jgi:hypothetical protein
MTIKLNRNVFLLEHCSVRIIFLIDEKTGVYYELYEVIHLLPHWNHCDCYTNRSIDSIYHQIKMKELFVKKIIKKKI